MTVLLAFGAGLMVGAVGMCAWWLLSLGPQLLHRHTRLLEERARDGRCPVCAHDGRGPR